MITTQIFTDPDAAEPSLDAADQVVASTKVEKSVKAVFERLRGQWLLEKGRFGEAATIEKAVAGPVHPRSAIRPAIGDVKIPAAPASANSAMPAFDRRNSGPASNNGTAVQNTLKAANKPA